MKYRIKAIEHSAARVSERFLYLDGFYGERGGVVIQDISGKILGEVTWYDDSRLNAALKVSCRDDSWLNYWEHMPQVGEFVEV